MLKLGQYLQNYTLNNSGLTKGVTAEERGEFNYPITKLGIKAPAGTEFTIDKNKIIIGNSETFEIDNVIIREISVPEGARQVMINYLYETEEME